MAYPLKKYDLYVSYGWSTAAWTPPSGTYTLFINQTGCFICQIIQDTSITIPSTTSVNQKVYRGLTNDVIIDS